MHIVSIPGYGGSGPDHWQTAWERQDPAMVRIAPASWDQPDLDDWTQALDRAAGDASDVVLVAHSLGCVLAAHWVRRRPERVLGAFLVAVPDTRGVEFPEAAGSFRAVPLDEPLGVPAVSVTSADDPYCAPDRAAQIARAWRAGHVPLGPRGHINADSGVAEWAEGRALFTAFRSGLDAGTGLFRRD